MKSGIVFVGKKRNKKRFSVPFIFVLLLWVFSLSRPMGRWPGQALALVYVGLSWIICKSVLSPATRRLRAAVRHQIAYLANNISQTAKLAYSGTHSRYTLKGWRGWGLRVESWETSSNGRRFNPSIFIYSPPISACALHSQWHLSATWQKLSQLLLSSLPLQALSMLAPK